MKENFFESDVVDSLYFESVSSTNLIVFLPAANGKSIHPRYPRYKWKNKLNQVANVLYISDPFQCLDIYKEPRGSWYISNEGDFMLPKVAKELKKFIAKQGFKSVLFYGSSMGGFAALILASLIENSYAFAECPQLFLRSHIGSRFVVDNILKKDISIRSVEPYYFLSKATGPKATIYCSIHDKHFSRHIQPMMELIARDRPAVEVEFTLFNKPKLGLGHVSLEESEALILIKKYFECE